MITRRNFATGYTAKRRPEPRISGTPTYHPLCCLTGKAHQRWVDSPPQKYSYLQKFCFAVQPGHPARHKGRFAIVTGRGPGCGGRDGVGARWWLQGGDPVSSSKARYDTALTASLNGLDGERTPAVENPARMCADGEVVWS